MIDETDDLSVLKFTRDEIYRIHRWAVKTEDWDIAFTSGFMLSVNDSVIECETEVE